MKKSASMIDGSDDEQYAMLWDYCEEMKRTNPGSTVVIKTEALGDGSGLFRFKRIYICFDALKKGFSECCRPVIGLDGCHLTGPRSGILLRAIGRDGNNKMYPVAFAVIEAERAKTWRWFVKKLKQDLCMVNSYGWTIISDKQKVYILHFSFLTPILCSLNSYVCWIFITTLLFAVIFCIVGIEGSNRNSIAKFRTQVLCAIHAQ